MIKQIDAIWWHKLNGGLRWGLAHGGNRALFLPLVNEYPKSGGSWLAQMLAEALELPFPRNRLPMLRSSLLHGHYRKRPGMRDVVIVWRDGRDVMVSWYFHRVVGNEYTNAALTQRIRERLGIKDPQDCETYLPRFIEDYLTTPSNPRFSWVDFVNDWAEDKTVVHTRYEDMLADAPGVLRLAVLGLTGRPLAPDISERIAAKFSFSAQSRRAQGEEAESSYLRKGIAGDWRNRFNREAREIFAHHAGDALIRLGYEADSGWVTGQDTRPA